MKAPTLISLGLSAALALSSPLHAAEDPLKVGFVYVSPIGDAGWTYMHDRARKIVDKEFGDRVETTYVESVSEGSDSQRVIRNLSANGHDLIFTTSFGYMNPTLRVARQFPNVRYEHATGYKTAENVGNYQARAYQGRYLAGMAAGAMTETDTIGYVAGFPIPEVLRGINAFTLGVREVNPDASVSVSWINSWHDPAKERESAASLIRQDADVLTMHADSPAVVQAAQDEGVYGIGYNSNMKSYGPDAHLTSVMMHWEPIYQEKIQAVLNDSWEPESIWYGLSEGVVKMAPMHSDIPEAVVERINTHRDALINGDREVFQGPINNQDGEEIVAKGDALKDQQLLEINWYVEGIEGKLPN
ncbi:MULTISPECIES: BMP family ABC transporter substrate-binding protein [Halomonadaceae]|uniref:BMP family ABC transporter substrate-binding protein n=1 Tax=Vreelandella halophila TaxID=86177 RepID=A0A9X4YEU0_9GAMM|nr:MULTISPECIES: BMP family ABC transporter substrate-binding protein [Halomonas]MYL27918.1 BMP family ABC transporter substrate-binding protein [Halomonas utahensis]MYL75044.1 BMP family ABC transporter substrate-binding protein [Halomonas sp. 22501_18_FS]